MATVYKVELEIVSHWQNYTPEQIKNMVEGGIIDCITNNEIMNNISNEVEINKTKVERN